MTIDPNSYLSFADILLYDVVGGLMLFGFIGQIIILVICGKYQIPYQGIISLSLLWWSVLVGMYYDEMIWVVVVLAFGTITYYIFSKLVKR